MKKRFLRLMGIVMAAVMLGTSADFSMLALADGDSQELAGVSDNDIDDTNIVSEEAYEGLSDEYADENEAGISDDDVFITEDGATVGNPRNDGKGNVVWDCVYFGSYYQSSSTSKEKIKWRVLNVNGNDAFLLADMNLDCKPYNTSRADVTWQTCTLRSWLNGYGSSSNSSGTDYSGSNFISTAFNSSEQSAIKTTTVVNADNPEYGTNGGNNTSDKIFLLSLDEVKNGAYGFSTDWKEYDDARRAKNTAYAKQQGVWTSQVLEYAGNGDWWLRSPGDDSDFASHVFSDGWVFRSGDYVYYASLAVRPALHLNLSSSTVWSYAGTVTSDGTVSDDPGPSGPTISTVALYDGDAAVAYAKNHMDSTTHPSGVSKCNNGWLCAEFVSNCLKAGGLNIYEPGCGKFYNKVSQYGNSYDIKPVKVNGYIRIKNTVGLEPGDVCVWYCPNHKDGKPLYLHAILVSGTDKDGYIKAYAHNNNAYDKTASYSHESTHELMVKVVHIKRKDEFKGLIKEVNDNTYPTSTASVLNNASYTDAVNKYRSTFSKYSDMLKKNGTEPTGGFFIAGLINTNQSDGSNKAHTDTMIPQGLTLAGDYILVSAYDSENKYNSVIYVYEKSSKKYLTTLVLENSVGNHVGGLAWNQKKNANGCVYICSSYSGNRAKEENGILKLPYEVLSSAVNYNTDVVRVNTSGLELIKNTNKPSYITYFAGRLYVGTFQENKPGYMCCYDSNGVKIEDNISLPINAQGIQFVTGTDGNTYLFVSSSYGRKGDSAKSIMSAYRVLIYKNETYLIPLLLDGMKMPNMAEDITEIDHCIYVVYESAGKKYRLGTDGKGKSENVLDVITPLSTSKLINSMSILKIAEKEMLKLKKAIGMLSMDGADFEDYIDINEDVEYEILAEGECGENLYYTLDNQGTLLISGFGDMDECDINSYPWELYKDKVTTVVVDPDVSSISSHSMEGMANLYYVKFSDMNDSDFTISIGDGAFKNCTKLMQIDFEKAEISVGQDVFLNVDSDIYVLGESETVRSLRTIMGANGHSHSYIFSKTVTATCETPGYDLYICECGDEKTENVTEPELHSYVEIEKYDAKCEMEGNIVYCCENCGDYYEEILPETKHTNVELRDVVEATIDADGYSGDCYCVDCEELLSAGEVTHIEVCRVSFDYQGGKEDATYSKERIVLVGDEYGVLPTTTKDKYNFIGWYTDKNGGIKIDATSLAEIDGSQILYARWQLNEFKLSLNPNGGKVQTDIKTLLLGEKYGELPTPTRNGLVFAGWFTEKTGGTEVTADTIVNLTADQTLYAHWDNITLAVKQKFDASKCFAGVEGIKKYKIEKSDGAKGAVTKKGIVTSSKPGKITITPLTKVGKKYESIEGAEPLVLIIVKPEAKKKLDATVGQTIKVDDIITNLPANSNEVQLVLPKKCKVATYDEATNTVTLTAKGKVKLTVIVTNDQDKSVKYSCTVKIKE